MSFCSDSPAYVRQRVWASVRRWRWRLVEARLPHLRSGGLGLGAFTQPVFDLLRASHSSQPSWWSDRHRAALRSAFCHRQWPQARLHGAGLSDVDGCRLCARSAFSRDTVPRGTAWHRVWLCPHLEAARRGAVGSGFRAGVPGAGSEQATLRYHEFTRALVPHPAAGLPPAPSAETFEWVVPPPGGTVSGSVYIDGSGFDGLPFLPAATARFGWSFVAVGEGGAVVAAARGVPPRSCATFRLRSCGPSLRPRSLFWGRCGFTPIASQSGKQWCRPTAGCRGMPVWSVRLTPWHASGAS